MSNEDSRKVLFKSKIKDIPSGIKAQTFPKENP